MKTRIKTHNTSHCHEVRGYVQKRNFFPMVSRKFMNQVLSPIYSLSGDICRAGKRGSASKQRRWLNGFRPDERTGCLENVVWYCASDNMAIAHLDDPLAGSGCFRIVSDHDDGLIETII